MRIARANAATFVEWALALGALVTGATSLSRDHDLLSVLWFLVAGALFAEGVRQFFRDRRKIAARRTSRKEWGYAHPYSEWERLGRGRTHAVYSPVLNRQLASESPIKVSIDEAWFPSGRASKIRERWKNANVANEKKLRLSSNLLPGSREVRFQVTDYASFAATNRLAYEEFWDVEIQEPELTFEQVERMGDGGLLPSFENSNSSNHIGGDILAVGNGFTYLQRQGEKNGMYPGRWAGSASGSFDVSDLDPEGTLQDLVKNALLRELREEMSLTPDEVPSMEDTKIIGFARATFLGGKPQFFGVCRVGRINPRPDQFGDRFERIAFSPELPLVAALEKFVEQHHDIVAPSLEMLVLTVKNFLIADPRAEAWLMGTGTGNLAPTVEGQTPTIR